MTAVEWLENEMQKTYAFNQNDFDMFKQAKELEKQQMKEAFGVGINIGLSDAENLYYLTFEEWFEQFKNK